VERGSCLKPDANMFRLDDSMSIVAESDREPDLRDALIEFVVSCKPADVPAADAGGPSQTERTPSACEATNASKASKASATVFVDAIFGSVVSASVSRMLCAKLRILFAILTSLLEDVALLVWNSHVSVPETLTRPSVELKDCLSSCWM